MSLPPRSHLDCCRRCHVTPVLHSSQHWYRAPPSRRLPALSHSDLFCFSCSCIHLCAGWPSLSRHCCFRWHATLPQLRGSKPSAEAAGPWGTSTAPNRMQQVLPQRRVPRTGRTFLGAPRICPAVLSCTTHQCWTDSQAILLTVAFFPCELPPAHTMGAQGLPLASAPTWYFLTCALAAICAAPTVHPGLLIFSRSPVAPA